MPSPQPVAVLIAIDAIGGYQLRPLYLLVVPLIVLAAKVGGLYDKDELVIDHSTLNELPRLLNLATMFALLVWLARHYVVLGAPTTRDLLMLWAAADGRAGRAGARSRGGWRGASRRSSAACWWGDATSSSGSRASSAPIRRVTLVGVVRTTAIASDHTKLREIVERDHIHRIIIDTDATSAATTLEIVRAANATGLQVSLLPSMLGAVGGSVVFDDIGGLMLMGVPRFGLSRSSKALKRTFDLVGAGAGLVVRRSADGADRDRDQARLARPGAVPPDPHGARRDAVRDAQVPQHGRRRRRAQGFAASSTTRPTACSRSTTIRGSRASAGCCAEPASTSCRSSSTCWPAA